jgi:hypothetical protein
MPVASNVRLIWVQSPSIMSFGVGKSAACAVTSAQWGMRKGDVLEENLMQGVVCRTVLRRGARVTAAVCCVICPTEADVRSCTRG